MNALDNLAENHPTATGLGGTVTAGLGWFLSNIETINAVLRSVLLVVSIVCGLVTIALGVRKWIRERRERDRDRYYVERRRFYDGDDDIS